MAEKGLIGIQMSTIKKTIDALGVYETMKRCAEMGYHCIEISQIPMTPENVAEFKRAKADFGINIAAMNASATAMMPGMESLETHYDKILNDCHELDCDMLRIGMGPVTALADKDALLKYCETIEKYVQKLKGDGIDYYYHTHSVEFQRHDGKFVLDYIKENTTMGFELDIHWIWAGGLDPVKVINDCAGRVRLLHLKDFRIVINPDAFDFRKRMSEPKPAIQVNPMYTAIQFAEIGEGTLDIKGCIEAGLKAGSEYFLIEQDSTYDRDPLDSLRISRDNLISLGYGDWF